MKVSGRIHVIAHNARPTTSVSVVGRQYAPDSALLTWPMGLTAPSADAQRCAALKPRGHLLELGVDRCRRARLRPLPSWSQSTELPKSELRSRPSGPAGECGKRSSAGEPIISGASLKGALSKPT